MKDLAADDAVRAVGRENAGDDDGFGRDAVTHAPGRWEVGAGEDVGGADGVEHEAKRCGEGTNDRD